MFITCIMSGSGDRRFEGGVECLSGDWGTPGRPWERGNDEVMGNAHLHTIVVQSCIIKSVKVKDHFHSWLSSTQQYSSTR